MFCCGFLFSSQTIRNVCSIILFRFYTLSKYPFKYHKPLNRRHILHIFLGDISPTLKRVTKFLLVYCLLNTLSRKHLPKLFCNLRSSIKHGPPQHFSNNSISGFTFFTFTPKKKTKTPGKLVLYG